MGAGEPWAGLVQAGWNLLKQKPRPQCVCVFVRARVERCQALLGPWLSQTPV